MPSKNESHRIYPTVAATTEELERIWKCKINLQTLEVYQEVLTYIIESGKRIRNKAGNIKGRCVRCNAAFALG